MTDPYANDAASNQRLLGRWRLLRADRTLDFAPDVRMDFRENGRLLYSFSVGNRRQVIMLVYRVEDDILHTDNPVATHRISAHFHFGEGDALIFDFAGAVAYFVREL